MLSVRLNNEHYIYDLDPIVYGDLISKVCAWMLNLASNHTRTTLRFVKKF